MTTQGIPPVPPNVVGANLTGRTIADQNLGGADLDDENRDGLTPDAPDSDDADERIPPITDDSAEPSVVSIDEVEKAQQGLGRQA